MEAQEITVGTGVSVPDSAYFKDLAGSSLEVYHLDCKPAGVLSCSAVIEAGEQAGSRAFRVEFQGQPDRPLEQAMYQLRAADGTTFLLFIVPVGAGDDELRYAGCVNQDLP